MLSQVKLIAEPWDVGEGGYQVGNFPVLWTEWNGLYRDAMRDFWRGEATRRRLRLPLHRLGRPLRERRPAARSRRSTSSPRTTASRSPTSSRTTRSTTRRTSRTTATAPTTTASWNCGVEGPTDDPAVNALRARQQRNFLATLLLSQGVPMLLGGDELGRTQGGNNNALLPGQRDLVVRLGGSTRRTALLEFTRRLIALRREHPVFRRTTFLARRDTARAGCRTSGGSGPTAAG